MKLIRRIKCKQPPRHLKFSPDGSRFLVNNGDHIFSYMVDGTLEGKPVKALTFFDADYLNNEQIISLSISKDSEFSLAIHDIKTQNIVSKLKSKHPMVSSICVDQKHKRIFAQFFDDDIETEYREDVLGRITVFDFLFNKLNTFYTQSMPLNLRVSQSGNRLLSVGVFVEVWDISGEPKRLTQQIPVASDCSGTPCEANRGAITPDGRFAAGGFHGGKHPCVVINGISGEVIDWYGPLGNEWDPYYATRAITLSPDGKYIALALEGTTRITFYRIPDGEITHIYDPKEHGDVLFSPKGDILMFGGKKSVSLWEFMG